MKRVYLAALVGLTLAAFVLILSIRSKDIPLGDLLGSYSAIVFVVSLVTAGFVKYGWAMPALRGWFVHRPDIRGTWKVRLHSNYKDPETGLGVPPIDGFAVVRQSLESLSLRLMTSTSRSQLLSHSIRPEEDVGLYQLAASYRCVPNIEERGQVTDIHHGALLAEIHEDYPSSFHGHYWTDRKTYGTIQFIERCTTCFASFEAAEAQFKTEVLTRATFNLLGFKVSVSRTK